MGKLFVWEFLSLDGITESPDKWVGDYDSPDIWDFITAQNLECDALILGRKTYQDFITFWPSQTNANFPFADHLNTIPKFVVSSTLEKADWNNTTVLSGDAAEAVRKLKARNPDEKIGLTGSPTLVQALIEHDLIDEYRLMVYPIVLGSGARLFQDTAQTKLKLVEAQPFRTGVVGLSYQTER